MRTGVHEQAPALLLQPSAGDGPALSLEIATRRSATSSALRSNLRSVDTASAARSFLLMLAASAPRLRLRITSSAVSCVTKQSYSSTQAGCIPELQQVTASDCNRQKLNRLLK